MSARVLPFPQQRASVGVSVAGFPIVERGVYWALGLNADGAHVAIAIDSRGREIARIVEPAIRGGAELVVNKLWDLLDTLDPLDARLRLS